MEISLRGAHVGRDSEISPVFCQGGCRRFLQLIQSRFDFCNNSSASTRRQLFPDYNYVWGGEKKLKLIRSFYDKTGTLPVSDFQRVTTGCPGLCWPATLEASQRLPFFHYIGVVQFYEFLSVYKLPLEEKWNEVQGQVSVSVFSLPFSASNKRLQHQVLLRGAWLKYFIVFSLFLSL